MRKSSIIVWMAAFVLNMGILPVLAQFGGLAPEQQKEPAAEALGNPANPGKPAKAPPRPAPGTAEEKEAQTSILPQVAAVKQDSEVMRMRDPFWPIGWEPPPKNTGPVDASPKTPIQWKEAKKSIRVTALSKTVQGDFVAILQGIGLVEKGEVIKAQHKGLIYRWTVTDVTASGVKTKQLDVKSIKR